MRRLLLALLAGLPWTAACIPSNVVARQDRAVELDSARLDALKLEWRPAAEGDLQGLYRSVRITGDAASSVLRIYYYFSPKDGKYTGAALLAGSPPSFQTLSGTFELQESTLVLDDQRIAARATETCLELATDDGTVILQRVPIE